jgi:hypothetical protein
LLLDAALWNKQYGVLSGLTFLPIDAGGYTAMSGIDELDLVIRPRAQR